MYNYMKDRVSFLKREREREKESGTLWVPSKLYLTMVITIVSIALKKKEKNMDRSLLLWNERMRMGADVDTIRVKSSNQMAFISWVNLDASLLTNNSEQKM